MESFRIPSVLPAYKRSVSVYNTKQIVLFSLFTNVKPSLFTFVNMKKPDIIPLLINEYSVYKNPTLAGRYLTFEHIEPELEKLSAMFTIAEIGKSFLNTPVHSVSFGSGQVKILAWSQMHGNETTTTKALFDLFSFFEKEKENPAVIEILNKCTLKVIPVLNPDGAVRYTRQNVNGVDLNRDAQELKEEESRILKASFDAYKPDFCFNLHDQRTIFGAGDSGNPATLSFLAPACDESRSINSVRTRAMKIIASINADLQDYLPGQVGRYDDAFNLNCTGDTFQNLGVSTILFEAGHYKNDYLREETRKFMALSILSALISISSGNYEQFQTEGYFNIPENKKNFFDVILRNARIDGEMNDVAIQFQEKIKSEEIYFDPVVQLISPQITAFGHQEFDCKGDMVTDASGGAIQQQEVLTQILLNDKKLSIIPEGIQI